MGPETQSSASSGSHRRVGPIAEPVAVVIVNYRTPELTASCLGALQQERTAFAELRALVVDGGSGDGSVEKLTAWISRAEFTDWAELLPLRVNGGFGWANNQAIQRLTQGARPPHYIYLLNPDAEIEPGAVRYLAEYLNTHPGAAAVGSQLLEPDGSRTGSGFSFPSVRGEISRGARTGAVHRLLRVPPVAIDCSTATEVDWTTGASVMLRVAALRDVGLFDEGFFLYHEELELMWRLRRAGWTVAVEPRSRVRHIGGAATGITDSVAERRKPPYIYRSRTRFFGLTRGPSVAGLAFVAWLAGHAVWSVRHLFGLASRHQAVDHQLRDHVIRACPRKHDFVPAVAQIDAPPSANPAWMDKRWL
jgi:GT2 family glycosyltransferase